MAECVLQLAMAKVVELRVEFLLCFDEEVQLNEFLLSLEAGDTHWEFG